MPVLRVTCRPEHTSGIVTLLRETGEATDVIVVPQSQLWSTGDHILAEVERSGIDPFLAALEERHGLDEVRVSLQAAEQLVPAPDIGPMLDDEVVWSKVSQDIQESSQLSIANLLLLTTAACIAAIGIIQDQLLYIVGAMAISPDYLLVTDVNVAVVQRDVHRLRAGARALAIAFAAAAGGAYLLSLFIDLTDLVADTPSPTRQLTDFISHPDGLSVIVAIAAGTAGALAVTLPDLRGLVGVFVSITTIPAAANIGVALAATDWAELRGSAVQLLVNVALLIVAGSLVLDVRRRLATRRRGRPVTFGVGWRSRSASGGRPG